MTETSMIDSAAALDMLDGDKELYRELLEAYVAALPNSLDTGDAKMVHKIKGASMQIGAEKLGQAGQALEDVLKGKASGDKDALAQKFSALYEETVAQAKGLLAEL